MKEIASVMIRTIQMKYFIVKCTSNCVIHGKVYLYWQKRNGSGTQYQMASIMVCCAYQSVTHPLM